MDTGLYIAIGIVVYLGCSIICMGFAFAHFQGDYPLTANESRRSDFVFSLWWGLLTGLLLPIGIIMAYIFSERGKYGWRLR